jgi:hypothetical protein
MKPKPFAELNHLTFPVVRIFLVYIICGENNELHINIQNLLYLL